MPNLTRGSGLGGHRGQLRRQDLLTPLAVGVCLPGRREADPQRFFIPVVSRDVTAGGDDVVGQQAQP